MKNLFIITCFLFICKIFYSQTTQLWGMTAKGGLYDTGTIFITDSAGNNQFVEHSFLKTEGRYPEYLKLVEGADGKLYGLTSGGGSGNKGILFQYDPATNIYVKKYDFSSAYINGSAPDGSLMLASDGKMYGMTTAGGTFSLGVLFQYDPATNVYTKKVDFSATLGNYPDGRLIQASDGMLYGMTGHGGTNNFGVLFQYDPINNIYTKKIDFTGPNGNYPFGSLLQANDGKLYGMTYYGGINNTGIIFQYDFTSNILVKKYDFSSSTGHLPSGSFIQASDGKLYASTVLGGASNKGVLFQYDIVTNTYVKKIDFTGANGSTCYGDLLEASNGKIYGMTYAGGALNLGIIFQYDQLTNVLTKKMDFTGVANGGLTRGTLMQAGNGKLYGVTESGGTYNYGVLFQYDITNDTYTRKVDIWDNNTNGSTPEGSLMFANDGKLYGLTFKGGINNSGVIFQYEPNTHTYTKKLDLNSVTTGAFGKAAMIEAIDGKLYGMTNNGGTNGTGDLFQYDPVTNTYIKKVDFTGAATGSYPTGALMQASDGMLYGLTEGGGSNNFGVLFQYNPITSTYTKKIDFTGTANGADPVGSLVQASDGKLYGVTQTGGTNNIGVLFQYNPTSNVLIKKIDFAATANGMFPKGFLVPYGTGKLYGLTSGGGINNFGVLYQYDFNTNAFVKKFEFDGTANGAYPIGSLKLANNQLFYGLTSDGGANASGVLFQYDPVSNIFTKKMDFNGLNGMAPKYTALIEVPVTISTFSLNTSYCAGDTINVSFGSTGVYNSNNIFSAQLSDASGSFTSAVTIGTASATSAGTLTAVIPSLTTAGTGYKIRVNSSSPFITGFSNTVAFTVNSLPTVTVNSGSVCAGNSFTLNAGGANTYNYSSGSSIINPIANSTYTIEGTDNNGCKNTAISSISVISNPTVSVNSGSICAGSSFTLVPNGADTYTFSGGNAIVTPTVNTSYTITGSDINECLNAAIATITVSAPFIAVASSNSLICVGETATLTATGAVNYTWSNNAAGDNIIITPTSNVTYTVVGIDSNGCMDSAVIMQNVDLCLGINKKHSTDILISPNPFKNELNISLASGNIIKAIQIINSFGQVVKTENFGQIKITADMHDLPKGIYYLKVFTSNNDFMTKIAKE